MKLLNKIISLTMTVIMFFTFTPVQASDFAASLDTQQLKQLKQEIKSSITVDLPEFRSIYYNGIPDLKTIQKRYAIARENYEQAFNTFTRQELKQSK